MVGFGAQIQGVQGDEPGEAVMLDENGQVPTSKNSGTLFGMNVFPVILSLPYGPTVSSTDYQNSYGNLTTVSRSQGCAYNGTIPTDCNLTDGIINITDNTIRFYDLDPKLYSMSRTSTQSKSNSFATFGVSWTVPDDFETDFANGFSAWNPSNVDFRIKGKLGTCFSGDPGYSALHKYDFTCDYQDGSFQPASFTSLPGTLQGRWGEYYTSSHPDSVSASIYGVYEISSIEVI